MTFLKGNAPVPSWTLVCLVNFSETIPCCSLLSAALSFSRDHIGIGQFLSSRAYSYIRFHATNEHLLLFQQNFIRPNFLFLCFPAPQHTPSQQPLHRESSVIKDSYELFVFEQERFTFDWYLALSKVTQEWRERFPCAVAWCLRETDVPPSPALAHCTALPSLIPCSIATLTADEIKYKIEIPGELLTCSGSHGGDNHWSG